ncbi:hypothetical protein JCM10207_000283 [Rhodosporidiobolus poonsookiae]
MSAEHMQHVMGDVWPEGKEYIRPIVTTVYMILLCLLAVLFSRRLGTWHQLKRLPFMQIVVIVLLGESLLFIATSMLIVLGFGSSYSAGSCWAGIWLCIFLYAATKAILYAFLLEKLYIVHSHTSMGKIGRLQSWWYRGGLALWLVWVGVALCMIVGRIGFIRSDGQCIIGLKLYATIPMLVVDFITNVYLSSGFIIPIYRSNFSKAKRLARVSMIAAIAALITSGANILGLMLEHGHQLSWVCLGLCGLDVSFNSTAVYIVTTPKRVRDERSDDSTDIPGGKGPAKGLVTIGGTGAPRPSLGGGNTASRSFGFGRFAGSRNTQFTTTTGVGVTITEEVRVDEDIDEIPLPTMRRPSQFPLITPPVTAVSFREVGEVDEKGAEEKTTPGEERSAHELGYLPK